MTTFLYSRHIAGSKNFESANIKTSEMTGENVQKRTSNLNYLLCCWIYNENLQIKIKCLGVSDNFKWGNLFSYTPPMTLYVLLLM